MAIIISIPTLDDLKKAVNLKQKIESLEAVLQNLIGGSQRSTEARGNGLSAAGRARIAAAQKARWAKVRGKKGRRKMSTAGRAKVAAAARKRWRAAKATGKTKL